MVYFVGAGSGAPDLITVRGARLLAGADRIIYAGSLVNPALLDYAKKECLCQNSAEMTLEQVIFSIRQAEAQGQTTVRLHTGDPSVYGAIREQMDLLEQEGISYEVVPGVSSFCAAAAALKADTPCRISAECHHYHGWKAVPRCLKRKRWRLWRRMAATMVIFLSAGLLAPLTKELLSGAYRPDTPAAIVYKASWPDEKILRCTVETLEQTARANGISKTALIVVGDFLGESYSRSKLYDPAFTTGFREGTHAD